MPKLTLAVLGFLGLVLTSVAAQADEDEAPLGDAVRDLPIFDAHIHYKREAWTPYPTRTVIELMDRAGVAMALVSSTPDDGTIKLFDFAPGRIIPEVRPYHGAAGSSNWTQAKGMLDYITGRLDRYPHVGIGEFHVHSVDLADSALLSEIARIAVERKVLLHSHSGAGPIDFFYQQQPSLTIIWAHAGMTEPPSVIDRMMTAHPTLYADLSYREDEIIAADGRLDAVWEALLRRHKDRFMVGSDTWVNGQWAQYDRLIERNRQWLGRLPRAIAETIAFRNAERLFGRKISMDLIGTR
jgi:predicted TIM-barrel fold metal-dependent hydrolase